MKAGVEIYEYQPQILHAKLVVIDDRVYVGSANFDQRSFHINYELVVRLRVAAYETEYRAPRRLEATVIAVGNLTLGGTGKTPMVEYIARYLRSEDHRVAILTRGYGRVTDGMQTLNAPPACTGRIRAPKAFCDSASELGAVFAPKTSAQQPG